MLSNLNQLKRRLHRYLEITDPSDTRIKVFNGALFALICLNAFAVIVESLNPTDKFTQQLLADFEYFSMLAFSFEYIARVWTCTINPRLSHPLYGRIKYIFRPLSIADFLAVLPFWLAMAGIDLRFLRVTRFFRFLKFARFTKYSRALKLITNAVLLRKEELLVSLFLMLVMLILTSTLMFYAEADAQPDVFTSIPSTLWWGVVTFTTIGYGDVFPITTAGKIMGSIFGIVGISLFALPTAILTASLLDQMQKQEQSKLAHKDIET